MKLESFKKFKSLKKNEKLLFIILISLISLVTIWILQKPEKSVDSNENQDLGISIPQGQLIIPIELANGKAISSLITQYGVGDLFIEPQHKILAKNLKILKLNAEDQSFGALVPEKKSEFLRRNRRAAAIFRAPR